MHPKDLSIHDFTYTLPPERIAQQPLAQRDLSKLLIYKDGKISEDVFANLIHLLPENSTLIFNDTRVIHARLHFKNSNGAIVEVFLLEPVAPHSNMQLAMYEHTTSVWRCMIGNVKKWREEFLSSTFTMENETVTIEVRKEETIEEDFLVRFTWQPAHFSFDTILKAAGFVPLPPYIKRTATTSDDEQYQTVYATQQGSVAAPTAGLHFSEELFSALPSKKIHPLFVTLHVSAGTFLPVKSEQMSGHAMHGEQIVISKTVVEALLNRLHEPIICVGTTSLRTLESLYWLGMQLKNGNESLKVTQWEPYGIGDSEFRIGDCLEELLAFMKKKKVNQIVAETKLLIAPGYDFRFAAALITNFHLPKSTLLLLVAALVGDSWKSFYEYALQHDFRFLSYGDGSLLWHSS